MKMRFEGGERREGRRERKSLERQLIAGRGENWGGQRKGKGKRINWGAAKVQVREKIRK
jgi:hypothetical protein